jgi:Fe-S cluster biosynthesis and repair protein YggX
MMRMVQCIKLGEELEGLDFPPIPGELGQKIFDSVSKTAWQQWIAQQTIIINENRLNLADESARRYLRQQLEYFFFSAK